MAIEFRDVSLGRLRALSAAAPGGVVIGVVGAKGCGQRELLQLAGATASPASGVVHAEGARRYLAPYAPLDLSAADVVAIDHTLAPCDGLERSRARLQLERLRASGATVFLATHEAGLVRTLCDEAWWLEGGVLARRGDPAEIWLAYMEKVAGEFRSQGPELVAPMSPAFRRGDGRAEVVSIETLGSDGCPTMVWRSGEAVTVRAVIRYNSDVADPVVGIMIRTRVGSEVYGTNTELEQIRFGPCAAGRTVQLDFAFRCDLCNNEYTLTAASHDPDGTAHDWVDDAVAFVVADSRYTAGVANLRAKVTVDGGNATH